jgi:hypothetical protein
MHQALGLPSPWTVGGPLRCRGASPRYRDRLRARQPLRLPDLWRGGLSGLLHGADDLATPQFLPAPGLSERPRAARALRKMRRQEDRHAMGATRKRLHPAVRGDGDDHGLGDAGQGRRQDRRRTRHKIVARGPLLRRSGASARRRRRRHSGRHRRDRRGAATTISPCSSISTRPGCCSPPKAETPARSPRSPRTLYTAHRGAPEAVSEVCIDMSPAFKGVADLPEAAITFDKFHAVKIITEAVDQGGRAEQKTRAALRGTRYIWLRNPTCRSGRRPPSTACRLII